MLMAHPLVLSNLMTEYRTLLALHGEQSTPEVRQRMDDLAYTLCVSTGTRDVETAMIIARHRLPGARPEDDSVLTGGDDLLPAVG
ncbi:DUF5133 domain-containing protein [Streptomyces sp. SL13]|uniref:DUF5133 domain-containing protein n=1 Tax=Streptantibioticus silvisoli TaxID=2705255 RepID=A0AA90KH89_9ACTN|nr:DUF5133 domain-containing protein [Streptantibioticus silvisoli]MDI5964872.1 DUF5133 domain-containing protein [Streptantibioticus silvisoli]MDI5971129.1 DUF5133 domain-containing protein [Streptantibioticus silvisoli]